MVKECLAKASARGLQELSGANSRNNKPMGIGMTNELLLTGENLVTDPTEKIGVQKTLRIDSSLIEQLNTTFERNDSLEKPVRINSLIE